MGGRGASSINKKSNLDNKEQKLKRKVELLGDKLAEYSQYALPSYSGKDKATKSEQYYKYKNDYEKTRKQLNEVLDKKAEAQRKADAKKPKPHKTFVNSFGEATKREITSASYERQQKRLEREILNRLNSKYRTVK